MYKRLCGYFVLIAVMSLLLAACGGGGGGGAAAPTASAIAVTSDKSIALANGTDTSPEQATLTATTTAGRPITFVVTAGTGSLVNADVITNGSGVATVKLQRNPITGVNTREDITVTATADGITGTKTVRFINLPAQASVTIALNRVIQDLGTLTFDLTSSPTLSAPQFMLVTPLGAAISFPRIGPLGPGSPNTFAMQADAATSKYILWTVSPGLGITTRVNDPLVGFTYNIDPTIKSLPTFAVGATPAATTSLSTGAAAIAVSQTDFVATTVFSTDN